MVFDGMFKNGKVLLFGIFFLAIVLAAPALRGTEEPGQLELPSPLRFRTAPFLTTNNPLFGLAAGDLNGDGKSDLAYLPENGQLVVRLNTGERTFGPEVTYQTGLFQPRSVIAADINGDGIPDLIVGGGSGFQGCVSVFLGVGDGTFQSPILSPATNSNFELQGFPLIGPIAAGILVRPDTSIFWLPTWRTAH